MKGIFDAVLSPIKTGETAPVFSLIDLDGRKIDSKPAQKLSKVPLGKSCAGPFDTKAITIEL